MGGRFSDEYLRHVARDMDRISAAPTLPGVAVKTIHVESAVLAEIVDELIEHRKSLGLIDGIKPEDKRK